MNIKKHSRRKFFEISINLGIIPVGLFSLLPLSTFGRRTPKELIFTNLLFPNESDLERLKILFKKEGALIWLFTGDSITAGVKHTHGFRSYQEIFGERIRWELGRSRDIVINTGISGNTTQNIRDDFDWRIGQFRPAVVSLMIGTNDCSNQKIPVDAFEENLDFLIDKIRKIDSIPILQTPNVIIKENAPERADLLSYVEVVRKLAKDEKIILIDNYSYWKVVLENRPEINIFKEWLNDPLHPNGKGHSEIARLMFKELSIFDSQAATCGGKYYEENH